MYSIECCSGDAAVRHCSQVELATNLRQSTTPSQSEYELQHSELPLIISVPWPRTLDLIFSAAAREKLTELYRIVECEADEIADLGDDIISRTRYIIGQPPLSTEMLKCMENLRGIFNVEGNLINNMPYDLLFERGIHVLTTSRVFAQPVAELGLAMALNLARGIVDADLDFRRGKELWGGEGNTSARQLSGSEIGLIGFGDVGRAISRVLSGFDAKIMAYDPWLPASILIENGVKPAELKDVLCSNDFVFAVASVTSENQGALGADEFASMRQGAAFILLSRAEVVDFDALVSAVKSGHILAASDVFPEEPMPSEHRVRELKGFLCSAHRAGALDSAFKRMGEMLLEDMELIDRGLPPVLCKRAERETVARLRSKPVSIN